MQYLLEYLLQNRLTFLMNFVQMTFTNNNNTIYYNLELCNLFKEKMILKSWKGYQVPEIKSENPKKRKMSGS